ncbi:MAG TPA: hypothetical protein VJU61_14410 [Polyangiaceae bacterium]|nr:hypothetical protein [Polyangiaceae bacterium]
MKAPLSFGLIVAVAGALACSDSGDGVRDRGNGGSGNQTGSNGGTSSGGTAGTSSGGTAGTSSGGSAGTGSGANYGPALTINADGTVKDETGNTGINGAALVVASSGNPSAVANFQDGKLCMSGATASGFTDYGVYWGAQINLDLNRVANPAAGGDAGAAVGDAGAGDAGDAGGGEVLGTVAQAWDPRPVNVVGFSFKIDGPQVAPVLSVSAAPTGRDPSADPFCYRGVSPIAGQTIDVLFTDLRLACWNSPPVTSSIFQITDPATYTTINNLGWQINAGPELAYQFDFCISEIKPILAN